MALTIPHRPAQPASPAAHRLGQPTWAKERGAQGWSAIADIAGAFPGFAAQGGLLVGSRVRITERSLLVDEGRGYGFGIPLSAVDHLAIGTIGESGPRPRAALHLAYRDGTAERGFVIRPRADRLGWPRHRFGEALHAFAMAGHTPVAAVAVPPLLIPWEEARQFRNENVIWSGRVTAPLDPLGLSRASADLWLTTRSLLWSAGTQPGINRVPLVQVLDITPAELADQATTPVVVVGYQSDAERRCDLVFIFDRHVTPERNSRERGAIVVGFRSRGVALGALPAVDHPWRRAWWPASTVAGPPVATPGEDKPDPALLVAPEPLGPAVVAQDLASSRAFEAAALALLAEANARAHDLAPSGEYPVLVPSLAAALAELEAAELSGALTGDQAAARRATLLALSDAGSRLRTLVRLCQSDQISVERLHERRRAILEPLTRLIDASDRSEPEPASAALAPLGDSHPSLTQSQPASPGPPRR